MQPPTHLASGILIQRSLEKIQPKLLRYTCLALLCLLAHWFLDKLARYTYHPSQPLIDDWFWILYHIIVTFLTVYIFVTYWRKYKAGLLFSLLPDLDWIILYPLRWIFPQNPYLNDSVLHRTVFIFFDRLPLFKLMSFIPNRTLGRAGALWEFILLGILFLLLKRREAVNAPG